MTGRREDVRALFELPFPDLMFLAAGVHREHFDPNEVQISTLLSIKTGACPEDCNYCPQSANSTPASTPETDGMSKVLEEAARQGRRRPRFCMGAAWRRRKIAISKVSADGRGRQGARTWRPA